MTCPGSHKETHSAVRSFIHSTLIGQAKGNVLSQKVHCPVAWQLGLYGVYKYRRHQNIRHELTGNANKLQQE